MNNFYTCIKLRKLKIVMDRKKISLMMLSLVMFPTSSMLYAQKNLIKNDTIKERQIEEIYVKGQSLKSKNSTSKIEVVTTDEIKNMVVEQPLRLLERIPGINISALSQGGIADQFSLRGFTGAGHGGSAGVEIDGVILNEAAGHDGYADFNILIPIGLKKITVYKGPSSALYGGRFAQAGTVSLETRKGDNYNDIRLSGGSYGTFDAQYAFGKTFKSGDREDVLKTNFAIQGFTTDGYIKNSGILKANVSGRMAYELTDKSEIAVSFLGHKSDWGAPGYIPKEQYLDKKLRRYPHSTAENDGGRKTFLSERIDFNHKISDSVKLLVFGYAVQQDFVRYAKFTYTPTGQTERFYRRNAYALGASVNGNSQLSRRNLNWIVGTELYSDNTNARRWATTYRKRNNQTQDRNISIYSFSVYTQGELDLHRLFRPSIGLRFDVFGGYFKNHDPNKEPKQADIKDLSHFSPKLGFVSTLVDDLDFRANVSNGFSLPGDNMKYGTELKPIQLWQYETGFAYDNKKSLYLDITGFMMSSSREILERPLGSGDYVNAGKTRRMGIEAEARVNVTEKFLLRGAYTYTYTKIVEGDNQNKEISGLPKNQLNLGATYTSPVGLGVDLNFRSISNYYIDDANTMKDGAYQLVNFKLFYNFDKLFSNKGNVFVGINNLFNEYYTETIFDDLYTASPTRNVSVGINYSF